MKVRNLAAVSIALIPCIASGQIVINEIRIDDPSADDFEYVELYNSGGSAVDLDGLTYVVIGDGSGGSGVIEDAVTLPAFSLGAGARYLISNVTLVATGSPLELQIDNDNDGTVDVSGVPDFDTALKFENSDNVTHVLVTGFSGAVDDDLDTDDDGVLDVTPWTGVVDAIGLVETPTAGEKYYGAALGFEDIGPNGTFVPAHVYRAPDGGAWNMGSFGTETDPQSPAVKPNVLSDVQDTPGEANPSVTDLSVSLSETSVPENASDPSSTVVALTGTVSRVGTSGDLVVDLAVDDATEAEIDVTVTIPDGETTSAPFDIYTVNDAYPDGTQTVTVTASAGGFGNGTETFDVTDDGDSFSLVVNEAYYVVDPANGDTNGDGSTDSGTPNAEEFLELVNASASPLDLTGYTISNDFGLIHEIRSGTILNPGCALVVFGGGDVAEGTTAAFGGAEVQKAFVAGNPFSDGLYLSDDGEGVYILDPSDTEVFSLQLPDQSGNPTGGSYNLATDGDAASGYVLHTTLSANAWSPGTKVDGASYCTVTDTITVTLSAASVGEEEAPGSVTATITLSSPVPTGLVLGGQSFTLVTDDSSELVPQFPAVFIAEGQTSLPGIPFDPVNDTDADGTQPVLVTVAGSNYLSGSASIDVTDDGDQALMGDLFISEYGEGSSFNKYLEIYNPTGVTVSLDGYLIGRVQNAPSTEGEPEDFIAFTPGATLADGEVWVIANPGADPAILAVADQESGSIAFNGDDGYGLVKGTETDFVLIDTVGNWDGDPGSGWDVAGVTNGTQNHTLVRKDTVTEGNADWAASAGTNETDSEWIVLDSNTWTSLGVHPGDAPSPDGLVITGFFVAPDGTVAVNVIGLSTGTSYSFDESSDLGQMDAWNSLGSFDTTSSNVTENPTNPGEYQVIYNDPDVGTARTKQYRISEEIPQ